MTSLLVSVRNRTEAVAAIQGGADWIDIKEPRRGALGAADPDVWREIAAFCCERQQPLSIALGELPQAAAFTAADLHGVEYAKVGLAGCAGRPWQADWLRLLDRLPAATQPVAVIYADWQAARAPSPSEVLAAAVARSCAAVLIDTFEKNGAAVFDVMAPSRVADWLAQIAAAGMLAVLGGSLTLELAPTAIAAGANILAVRGAVCSGNRESAIAADKVSKFAAALGAS